jgi:hypothetical protein
MPSAGGRPRVVLHVGTPKSGTTYLQRRLVRNAATLGEAGILVPLGSAEERPATLAFRAALDLTGKRMGRPPSFVDGYWGRLVDVVSGHPGGVVISHEAFARCTPRQAARAVGELGETHEVHVVVTARDLARSLVSAWLEGLKHGTGHDLAEHLARAEAGTLSVMRSLDLPLVLGTWLAEVGADRVHLVTVPPAGGPGSLWLRFCEAAGIDEGTAPRDARARNEAVGVAEAQLLLALNRRFGADLARGGRLHTVARRTVVAALTAREHDPVRLGAEEAPWLVDRALEWSTWVASSNIRVVGDLTDLLPAPLPDAVPPDWSSPHPDVVEAAADALHAALHAALDAAPMPPSM